MSIRTVTRAIALALACGLVLSGCAADTAKAGNARQKGRQAAEDDLKKGLLKQKEYPPLPYSLQMMRFIKLMKSECGVEWEVVSSKEDSKELREEVAGYNEVMRTAIEKRFGPDVFARLRKKAEENTPAAPGEPGRGK
ncbi:MAG TPA: hypothetical protein VFE78_16655 [Gemmataceae bacterium]|nr:hypothetical protein [Gemmataceae bacterium]